MRPNITHGIDVLRLRRALSELGDVDDLRNLGRNGPLKASAGPDSLFHCLFGRDALRMAMDLLHDFPAVAHSTLVVLASMQGVRTHPRSEEEPGRMLHEHRLPDDPEAIRLSKYWDWPYYGAADTTPQWINLLGAYTRAYSPKILAEEITTRDGRKRSVRESLTAAIGWITHRLDDSRGRSHFWVQQALPGGSRNQVWEDSSDAFHYPNGSPLDPSHPFAPVALQGYVYDALLNAADLCAHSDHSSAARNLLQRARRLRDLVLSTFWQPDLDTFAHAVVLEPGGNNVPVRVIASASGHLLASHILDGPAAAHIRERLAARLVEPDLLAMAGVRTKSTRDPLFRAGSYHNGSVWPMDSGVIADGLRRHGYTGRADDLESRILQACGHVGGFPEFFRGETRATLSINLDPVTYVRDGELHYREQRPQRSQGWTVTRVWNILRRRGLALLPGDTVESAERRPNSATLER